MPAAPELPARSRVQRDIRIMQALLALYAAVALLGWFLLGLRWWALVLIMIGVIPFGMLVTRELTSRTLLEIAAHPPRVEAIRDASAREFEDVFADPELASFGAGCWVGAHHQGRPHIVGPVRYIRSLDELVVVSVGAVGNAGAISRLDDGRWFVTQWLAPFPLAGVIVQLAPNTSPPEVLARHRDALAQAADRNRHAVPIEIMEAATALQDLETAAISAMSRRERRRAAGVMSAVAGPPAFDPDVF